MKVKDALELDPGIYQIQWSPIRGGSSVASIYIDTKGDHWIAPSNWTSPDKLKYWATQIKYIISINTKRYE